MLLDDLFAVSPDSFTQSDKDLIEKAYYFAEKAHEGQKRASGEPYITHCLAVAEILTELNVPPAIIVSGLLHDTVEDTPVTLDEIREEFGEEVARLVDGVTKLNRIETRSENVKQAENFGKLLLAMSDDLRVLLDLARRHSLWIIADEIYGRFFYEGGRAPSFHDILAESDRVLFVQTFSKNWAMTGLRIGWLEAPPALGQVIENLIQVSTSGAPVPG